MPTHRHLAVAAGVLLLAGCSTDAAPSAPPATSPPATAAPEPTAEPGSPSPSPSDGTVEVAVYAMTDTRAGLRLTREPRAVEGPDPVAAAVTAMIAGPVDPDYTSPWDPGTEVLGVSERDGVVVVDLSGAARDANVGSEAAALMVQQLVHTVTDAAGDPAAPVLLTLDGRPAGELWGAVVWQDPVTRADPLDVRSLVAMDRPAEGARVTSPVTVAGEAAAFEATLGWTVLDAAGSVVQEGFTMTPEGQTFAPYRFTVDLPPGTYTVVVTETDPSDGAAGTPMSDSRTITVG